LASSAYADEVSCSDELGFARELEKPEEVLAYLKAKPPETRRKKAEEMYDQAQDMARGWESVARHSLESVRLYPTSKALWLSVESMLRIDQKAREQEVNEGRNVPLMPRSALERAARWLDLAVSVETYERSLDDKRRDELVFYRNCVIRYLDSGKVETGCWPLQWAYVDGIPYSRGTVFGTNGGFYGSLGNPEQLLAYLRAKPSETRKKTAEDLFAMAQKQVPRIKAGLTSWGAVAKYCMESISAYPTGKAFVLGVEGWLRSGVKTREEQAREGRKVLSTSRGDLERAAQWLDSAVAVENYERSLDDAGHDPLIFYRDCVNRHLATGQPEAECAPLEWAGAMDGRTAKP
jgi:hypothetical protein